MKVQIRVWSDNHGKDETFDTRPNGPHYLYGDEKNLEEGADLLNAIMASLHEKFLKDRPDEPVYLLYRNSFVLGSGIEEVRVKIAEEAYVCSAIIGL